MAVFFYNIFLLLFRAGTHIAALFNAKAGKWVHGRKDIFRRLAASIPAGEKIIWVHCASLGEFEQGKTVIEELKRQFPRFKILITFFSPSGYEVGKNYAVADWVFYLPMDGAANARRFLEIVHPSLVIFIKYEFWYYYLKKIKYRNIPLLLISALFRKDMSFFKWYGGLQRKMLSRFDHLFVQNASSNQLLKKLGLGDISSISGDTRFDRVIEIEKKWDGLAYIESFAGNYKVIVAGSTWKEDELVIQKAMTALADPSIRLIIAPHVIDDNRLTELSNLFPGALFYSKLGNSSTRTSDPGSNCLIIDNIGMLARLYKYGYLTYVGGGMKRLGVHNVLEAAVFDKIVLFGPYYHKYSEAVDLVLSGGGLPFEDPSKNGFLLAELIRALMSNKDEYNYRSKAAGDFVRANKGATGRILQFIQEKRLLTN